MDDSGNIYLEEQIKGLPKLLQEKLIEIMPEEQDDVFNMSTDNKKKWYKNMVGKRRKYPIPR